MNKLTKTQLREQAVFKEIAALAKQIVKLEKRLRNTSAGDQYCDVVSESLFGIHPGAALLEGAQWMAKEYFENDDE